MKNKPTTIIIALLTLFLISPLQTQIFGAIGDAAKIQKQIADPNQPNPDLRTTNALKREVEQLKTANADLKSTINEKNGALSAAQGENDRLQEEARKNSKALSDTERALKKAQGKNDRLRSTINEKDDKISEVEKENDRLQEEATKNNRRVKKQSSYIKKQYSYIKKAMEELSNERHETVEANRLGERNVKATQVYFLELLTDILTTGNYIEFQMEILNDAVDYNELINNINNRKSLDPAKSSFGSVTSFVLIDDEFSDPISNPISHYPINELNNKITLFDENGNIWKPTLDEQQKDTIRKELEERLINRYKETTP